MKFYGLLSIALLSLVLSGCGGSSEPVAPKVTAPPPTDNPTTNATAEPLTP